MAKSTTIRNEELDKQKAAAHNPLNAHHKMVLGIFPRQRLPLIILFLTVTIGSFLIWGVFQRPPMLEEYTYEIVAEYPHDSDSFTQGLIFRDGFLYESSGQYGRSELRKISLQDGEEGRIIKQHKLDDEYFGEGLCQVDDKLIQLTWKEETGFIYDMDLNKIGQFTYDAHGWGLTYDGKHLIMSDGTSTLYYMNPKTFEVENKVFVRKGNRRMPNINELEFINNTLFANVLGDDMIYLIQPTDGKVIGRINFEKLLPKNKRGNWQTDVMNGIALRPDNGNLLVTGKNWPTVFEVKISKAQAR